MVVHTYSHLSASIQVAEAEGSKSQSDLHDETLYQKEGGGDRKR